MPTPDSRLIANSPEVAAKVIDGEAIIINLATGMYYSMDRAGALVWEWLERGHSIQEIIEGVVAQYDVAVAQAEADVNQLIDRLLEDGLARVSEAGQEVLGRPAALSQARLPYQAPQLTRYDDMAALLALDPPMPIVTATPWTSPENSVSSGEQPG